MHSGEGKGEGRRERDQPSYPSSTTAPNLSRPSSVMPHASTTIIPGSTADPEHVPGSLHIKKENNGPDGGRKYGNWRSQARKQAPI